MKILKIAGIVVLAILLVVFVVVLFQPSKGHLERSIVINAHPSLVYYNVNSFTSFKEWSAWAKMDPQAKYTFEGPESGVGAKMSWDGKETGRGSQTIVESDENKRVRSSLVFEGFDGKAYAEFVLAPEGDGTKVTWTYDGENAGVGGKAMWMVMKTMLGGQYESGLADLKKWVESQPKVPIVETK